MPYVALVVWLWLLGVERSRNAVLLLAVWMIGAVGITLGLYSKDKLGLRRGRIDYQEKDGVTLDPNLEGRRKGILLPGRSKSRF